MNAFELIGVIGFISYLLSYTLLQLGKIKGDSARYTILNMISASLVLISLAESFNLASALIQIAWILISIAGLIRILFCKSVKLRGKDSNARSFLTRVDHHLD